MRRIEGLLVQAGRGGQSLIGQLLRSRFLVRHVRLFALIAILSTGLTMPTIAPAPNLFTQPALSQGRQQSTLETLQGIFRPRRRPAGTRGPICLITPGLKPEWVSLSEIPLVLSDRPLLLWQRSVTRVEVRQAATRAVVWNQTLPPNSNSIVYQGMTLQPGQTYQVVAFGRKDYPLNDGEDAQFTLVGENQRIEISTNLSQLETELKISNASDETIAIAKATALSRQSLLSDAFQLLYTRPERSPQLNSFLSNIATQTCGQ